MVKVTRSLTFLTALVLGLAGPLAAEDSLSSKMDEILVELRQLRSLIQDVSNTQARNSGAPTVAATATGVTVGTAPFLGSKDAPLTIVEFTDFQCPFCKRFFVDTFPDLKKNYIDSGKVRFYSLDLPLEIHSNALLAAQAGRCAGEQGQFWAMHDRMQKNPARLDMASLLGYAGEVGIDAAAFRLCVESEKYKEVVQREAMDATRKGARGTPTFVIGKSTLDGVEGELLIGAQPYNAFDEKLRGLSIVPQ